MRYHIFSIGLLTSLVVSCSVNEIDYSKPDSQSSEEFYAQLENPGEDSSTKVFATEDLYIRWNTDDRITIFNKYTYNQEYRFNGETGDNSGSFKMVDNGDFVTGNSLDNIYAIYPYLESTKISDTGVMTVTLPSEQHYAENTFGLGANTMISATTDNQLMFKNVGGFLMLKLYGDDVTVSSITLKGNNGEKLSGKANVSMPVGGVPDIEMTNDAGEEITLVCDTPVKIGSTAETATTFWMVVPPTVFSKGFTIMATDNKNDVFEKATSMRFDISRSKLTRMSPLKTEFPGSSLDPDDFSSQYLTFEILSDGSISWVSEFNAYTMPKTIEYSLNNGPWAEITSTKDGVSISVNKGDKIRFRGDNESYGVLKVINSENRPWYNYFRSTCQFKVYGNIMSLINSTKFKDLTVLTESCTFYSLFKGCVNLVDASHLVLPAITLTERCYWEMFRDCTNLMSTPILPATNLADYCYCRMFYNCKALIESPVLPASTLASHCYEGLFYKCSNLTSAPDLPARTLTDYCYSFMFYGCSNLVVAPQLPATTLSDHCYYCMFYECSSLLDAPALPATNLADYCYYSMFFKCANLKTAAVLSATTLADYCCFQMFSYCPNLASAPELLAEVLVDYCYYNMFFGCTSLQYIKCLATDISASNCTTNWAYDVSSTGAFVKDGSMDSWPSGANGIPKGWTVKTNYSENIKAVDLGLSVKWANMNVGAARPEEYGHYYAWGETEPYYISLDPLTWKDGKESGYAPKSYKWCMGDVANLTKYCNNSYYGYKSYTDSNTVLDKEDDAAHMNLRGNWRMPTNEEWIELLNNCSSTWTTEDGMNGRRFTSNINGNSIFLPAQGYMEAAIGRGGSGCFYFSSSLYLGEPISAWYYYANADQSYMSRNHRRWCGLLIRPVYEE